ncbi:MAG: hydroxyacid dehydrogenase [Thermoplasmata archaeon]|nr:hydroxyacid dehydrogenase [Thermoplasmata archaeon]
MTANGVARRVLVTDPIHDEAVQALRRRYEVVVQEVPSDALPAFVEGFDAIIVRSRTKVTREVLTRDAGLRVVGRAGAGVDNIDMEAATERGIPVVNAPGGNSQSVAELTVGLMLSLARHIPEADRTTKSGGWEKGRLRGSELAGKVLGLVGSGRIGTLVAHICQDLGMETVAYDPYVDPVVAQERGIWLADLEQVLGSADFVSVHAALTEETNHMLSGPQLALMKPTAYLLNVARGPIVDEEALVEALESGGIAGAALDVFEKEPPEGSPLLAMDNVVLTPHLGAATEEAQRRTGLLVAEQVTKTLEGEVPDFLVNPEILSV